MSLLPQKFLKSIVLIKNDSITGTGFLYGIKLQKINTEGLNHYMFFLVTNKHIANIKKPLTVRYNKTNGHSSETVLDENVPWLTPTNTNIDLAILPVNYNFFIEEEMEYEILTEADSVYSEEEFLSMLHIGQEIFLAGFPLGISGIQKNYPIARLGIIARNDIELLSQGSFYLDVNNFPGNSGGPIFIKPTNSSLEGEVPLNQSKLIGVICAYQPFSRTLFDNSQNPPVPMSVTHENSGIAIGVPIYIVYNLAKEHIESIGENIFEG